MTDLKGKEKFFFGFSESGFQFEMGIPGSEDPNSDWWVWVHDGDNIASGLVSGDLPENGTGYWDLYKVDHNIAEFLSMDAARIGVEWSRIFPRDTRGVKVHVQQSSEGGIEFIEITDTAIKQLDELSNKQAVKRYRELLSDWKNRDKLLILNLYHWTMPTWLHDPLMVRRYGPLHAPSGWLSKDTIVEFAKFAAYMAHVFDEIVDYWSIMNEPNVVYMGGYFGTGFPPGIINREYMMNAARNLIEAVARAYDAVKQYSRKPVGLIHAIIWFEPKSDTEEAIKATNRAEELWQKGVLDSLTRGQSFFYPSPRKDLRNHIDWLGVNYYSRHVVDEAKNSLGYRYVKGLGFSCGARKSLADRVCSDIGWEFYPEGLYKILLKLWKEYMLPMIITENGVADAEDSIRHQYIFEHVRSVFKAIREGVDVKGYLHWALTDNYEWASGFRPRFGLVEIDYVTKRRRIRPSAIVLKHIIHENEVLENYVYDPEVKPR
ncbi:MAG: beta-galactosidase BgaS [Infirmifilum sp.]|uniref:beta-galactosidase BgaS n=1 Tax=Infirmifilum TaxID=2856573 RepID=UPI003C707853